MSSDEAKRAFAKEVDEINRRSQMEGAGSDAASDLAEILAEHERECAALEADLAEAKRGVIAE